MTAATIVTAIQQEYNANPQMLDFYTTQHLSGENRKQLRQEVMRLITGNERPAAKCTVFAVATQLKYYYSQPRLF